MDEPNKLRELPERLSAATEQEQAAIIAELTEEQQREVVADLQSRIAELQAQLPAPTNFLGRLLAGEQVIQTSEELEEFEARQKEIRGLCEAVENEDQAEYIAALEKQNRALLEFIAREPLKGKPN